MKKIISLIGPNGVGKSHICRILQRERFAKYYSIEEIFMEEYGSLDNFRVNRKEAYQFFEGIVRKDRTRRPIIFEESGISNEASEMINRLKKDFKVYLVEVTADLRKCLVRVKDRGTKENFPKDDNFVIESKKRYSNIPEGRYLFDMKIDNDCLTDKEIIDLFGDFF